MNRPKRQPRWFQITFVGSVMILALSISDVRPASPVPEGGERKQMGYFLKQERERYRDDALKLAEELAKEAGDEETDAVLAFLRSTVVGLPMKDLQPPEDAERPKITPAFSGETVMPSAPIHVELPTREIIVHEWIAISPRWKGFVLLFGGHYLKGYLAQPFSPSDEFAKLKLITVAYEYAIRLAGRLKQGGTFSTAVHAEAIKARLVDPKKSALELAPDQVNLPAFSSLWSLFGPPVSEVEQSGRSKFAAVSVAFTMLDEDANTPVANREAAKMYLIRYGPKRDASSPPESCPEPSEPQRGA